MLLLLAKLAGQRDETQPHTETKRGEGKNVCLCVVYLLSASHCAYVRIQGGSAWPQIIHRSSTPRLQ